MAQREFLGWQRYWRAEPWGPWRDNLHMAVLAREVIKPHLRKGVRVRLADYFYRDPEERQHEARAQLISSLRMIGRRRHKSEPRGKRKAKGRRSNA
jgi:hypothetical protein